VALQDEPQNLKLTFAEGTQRIQLNLSPIGSAAPVAAVQRLEGPYKPGTCMQRDAWK
jgi:hypothetical protein